jgi:hypothetical protein
VVTGIYVYRHGMQDNAIIVAGIQNAEMAWTTYAEYCVYRHGDAECVHSHGDTECRNSMDDMSSYQVFEPSMDFPDSVSTGRKNLTILYL